MSQVALIQCADKTYEPIRVEQEVRAAVDGIGGIEKYVQAGQRVLVKPNLLRMSDINRGVVTHPSVVRAVTRLVQEAGGQVVIGDSPGGPFSEPYLRTVYRGAGLIQVAEETGAELNYDTRATRVSVPNGRLVKSLELGQFAVDADVIISLPKLKTHGFMGFTGATKNLFGLIPGVTKVTYHARLQDADQFAEMLLDLLEFAKPAFSLMDGIVGMDGDGPSAGNPFPAGLLLCSADAVALDLVATHLAGMKLDAVLPLRAAKRRGLTSGRVEDLEIVGAALEDARLEGFQPPTSGTANFGFVPGLLRRLFLGHITASPRPNKDCVGCGVCVQNCPMHAITLVDRRAQIDLKQCIRCYCCHELCPHEAIDLSRPFITRLLK
jgi:uncharacterized protein (DUF362 family)/NAD-dependent dihydropyrimidine dehydrogenase PreA subunit